MGLIWFFLLAMGVAGCGGSPPSLRGSVGAGPAPQTPSIRLTEQAPAAFEVAGLPADVLARIEKSELKPEQLTALFAVSVDNGTAGQPGMLGAHRVKGDVLRFEPRFPLTAGVRYRAVFDPSRLPGTAAGSEKIVAEFALPSPKAEATTVVERVYPTRNVLPENQLKFYLHFSAQMSRGEAYDHIELLDAAGKPIEGPFLELGEELWDPSGTRFTLLIDPGRIKRGLKPREDVGPVLEQGKSYTLVIHEQWHDARGNLLKETFRKTFKAGPPVETGIDQKDWKVELPTSGKAGPLTVRFPRPLDHALLHRLLWVTSPQGDKVAGKVAVTDEETRWQFTPGEAWKTGTYHLIVDTTLEDLAGNRVGEPFEVDVFKPVQREVKTKTINLPLEIKAPAE